MADITISGKKHRLFWRKDNKLIVTGIYEENSQVIIEDFEPPERITEYDDTVLNAFQTDSSTEYLQKIDDEGLKIPTR